MKLVRPKVTFGLVSFNNAKYIGKALRAITDMEKPFTYEIVISDDGSTDDTVECVRQMEGLFDGRLRILPGDKNPYIRMGSGFRTCMNKYRLCLAARGEYCLLGDGDDFWCDPTFVREAVSILDGDCSLAAVFHNIRFVDAVSGKETSGVPLGLPEGPVSPARYLRRHYTHAGAFVFRNPAYADYAALGFIGCDDVPLQVSLATVFPKGNWYCRERAVYAYRQYEGAGWLQADRRVTELATVDYVLRCLPHLKGDVAKAVLLRLWQSASYLRRHLSSLPGFYATLEKAYCLRSDFPTGSVARSLCDWDSVPWWERLRCRVILLGVVLKAKTVLSLGRVLKLTGHAPDWF